LDKNDRIVASSEPLTGPMPLTYSELHGKSGVVTAKLNDKDVVVSYISSSATDWKYMIMMPQHVFWDKSEYIKKATVISLLACLIVGGGLSYAFVRKNYSPIRAMMELFKEQKEDIGVERAPLNEYDFMHQAIHSTLMENTDMSSRLWRQKSFMRGHFIEKLLKGRASAIPLEQSLETYGARFVSDAFAVMIFNRKEGICKLVQGTNNPLYFILNLHVRTAFHKQQYDCHGSEYHPFADNRFVFVLTALFMNSREHSLL